jgi:hypothetical protein
MEDIAVKGHFADIGTHIADARFCSRSAARAQASEQ